MKAYGVFDGGGVKGAALAGCLAAAHDQGVDFEGYGGTSAGSIVALLATVGYTGREIRDLMLQRIHPRELLDDKGELLIEARGYRQQAVDIFNSDSGWFFKLLAFRRLKIQSRSVVDTLFEHGGLYEGRRFAQLLLELVIEKLSGLDGQADVTFLDLEKQGCKLLKILASDISQNKAATFSINDTSYGNSVITAVRASASYPYLFRAVDMPDGRKLVDGGLASNLPAFLFAKEQRVTKYPLLAFDLISEEMVSDFDNNILDITKNILSTALEASDDILLNLASGVVHVPVGIPRDVDTLDFNIDSQKIENLFQAGYEKTMTRLQALKRLEHSKEAGEEIQKQLWGIHGSPSLFEPVLLALAGTVEDRTGAEDVRSSIMLPSGRPRDRRIVVYGYGFRPDDSDQDLELAEYGGCTGVALQRKNIAVADLVKARKAYAKDWGMEPLEQSKVADDRKSMLSVPIYAWFDLEEKEDLSLPLVGTLSVDSSTPLEDTGWLEPEEATGGLKVSEATDNILRACARVVSKLLS